VIYLDFQKAFDTAPHQRLIQKLSSFGIHGKMLQWIESFLNESDVMYTIHHQDNHQSVRSLLGTCMEQLFANSLNIF